MGSRIRGKWTAEKLLNVSAKIVYNYSALAPLVLLGYFKLLLDPVNYRKILLVFTRTETIKWGQGVALRKMEQLCAGDSLLPHHIHMLLVGPSQRAFAALLMFSGKQKRWVLPVRQHRH